MEGELRKEKKKRKGEREEKKGGNAYISKIERSWCS